MRIVWTVGSHSIFIRKASLGHTIGAISLSMRVMVPVAEICTFLVQFLHVGKMCGKKTEKNLVECILRGFFVPGAAVEIINLTKIILN